jgi:hypothetical protein
MFYTIDMKNHSDLALPGYVSVAGAAARLHLAPRSVRDLVYSGRLPSARLGRRHFLRVLDVEAERRRRLGLPLPQVKAGVRGQPGLRSRPSERPKPQRLAADDASQPRVAGTVRSEARHERAQQRAAEFERWLRSGHATGTPSLPFTTVDLDAETACDACRRPVRTGGRMVDAAAAEGRSAARLCLTCARRALLAWSDGRRREAVAARRLAQTLGHTYTPLLESSSAA